MTETTPPVISENALRDTVKLDLDVIDCVADAFTALSAGKAIMPPILRLDIPEKHGEVDIKTAYVEGFDGFCVKMSTGFFDNPKLGLPSLSGMMTVLDAETGQVRAVLLDNGYLTDIRTAAAGAVAARHLAPAEPIRAGIVGTGLQARLQLQALALVRDIAEVRVWGRDTAKAEALATDVPFDVTVVADADDLARASNVIVTTTPAMSPLFSADAVQPGTHVTAMGSDAPGKNELDPVLMAKADLVICDSPQQCADCGELRSAQKAGFDGEVIELGHVTAGTHPGRSGDQQITICDLTGCGVQDTAISDLAVKRLG
ncbi:MAG: cyclodeaminase [Rhodospirillales bacterium]|nr:cyclodeaminase [Rhodospirillales bacterium]MBO6788229.1 cyclodeaminase [Rhodospirillales bacterium]